MSFGISSDMVITQLGFKSTNFNKRETLVRVNNHEFITILENVIYIDPIGYARFTGTVDFSGATIIGFPLSGYFDPAPLYALLNSKVDILNSYMNGNAVLEGNLKITNGISTVGHVGLINDASDNLIISADTIAPSPSTATPCITILKTCQIGFGVIAPTERVDVDGNVKMTGNAIVGGDANITGDAYANNFIGSGLGLTALGPVSLHSDVDTTGAVVNDSLVWDGTNWVPGTMLLAIDQMTDVDTNTIAPQQNYVLAWDDTNNQWYPANLVDIWPGGFGGSGGTGGTGGTGASVISDLNDADSTGVVNGNILVWDGTNWVPGDINALIAAYLATLPATTAFNIDDLLDVDTVSVPPLDTWVLTFNVTTGQWEPAPIPATAAGATTVAGLTDTNVVAAAVGDIMTWNGTQWVSGPPAVTPIATINLTDVNPIAPAATDVGFVLQWNGAQYAPGAIPAGPLNDLTDVILTGPATGQYLGFNGANWVNTNFPTYVLNDLTNVIVPGPVANDVLLFNGANWVNTPATALVATAVDITTLGGVNVPALGTVPNGSILAFDTGTGEFEIDDGSNITLGSIDAHTDVDTTTVAPAGNDFLVYDGINWVPRTTTLNDLFDTNVGTGPAVDGFVVYWDNAAGLFQLRDPSAAGSFANLLDVNITPAAAIDQYVVYYNNGTGQFEAREAINTDFTTPAATNDFLQYNGTAWVPVSGLGSINSHTDVDTVATPPVANDFLTWNGANWVPSATIGSIDIHSDVDTVTTPPVANDFLSWNGANWVPSATIGSINIHSDVDTTTTAPVANDFLSYNGTNWVPQTGIGSIDLHTDVDTTTTAPVANDFLSYDGTNWVPQTGIGSIDLHTDVDTTTTAPVANDFLSYDGTNWVPQTGLGSIDLHTDVDTTTTAPVANDYLQYDGTNWIPTTDVNVPAGNITLAGGNLTTTVAGTNGRIGIGVAAPTVALDVAGDGNFTGTVTATTGAGGVAGGAVGVLTGTFTGQHYNVIDNVDYDSINDYSGLIVSANKNKYMKLNNGLCRGKNAITIDESLPILSITNKENDKSVFGVISGKEISDKEDLFRKQYNGGVLTQIGKIKGDVRTIVNSVGEGGIWVSNMNGPLESGDYITSCSLPGYGQKQNDDSLKNYTVAKITMDCDFNPSLINIEEYKEDENGEIYWTSTEEKEYQYDVRYLDENGKILPSKEGHVYIAAFVGCTYHCG